MQASGPGKWWSNVRSVGRVLVERGGQCGDRKCRVQRSYACETDQVATTRVVMPLVMMLGCWLLMGLSMFDLPNRAKEEENVPVLKKPGRARL